MTSKELSEELISWLHKHSPNESDSYFDGYRKVLDLLSAPGTDKDFIEGVNDGADDFVAFFNECDVEEKNEI